MHSQAHTRTHTHTHTEGEGDGEGEEREKKRERDVSIMIATQYDGVVQKRGDSREKVKKKKIKESNTFVNAAEGFRYHESNMEQ